MGAETHQPDDPLRAAGRVTLSVAICTRDRPDALAETLASLYGQTVLPDEILLVDDGELPATLREAMEARFRAAGIGWQYRRTEARGLTRARNLAARLARGDVILYLDDDVTCRPDLVGQVAAVMSDPMVAGLTARVEEPAFSTGSARLYQWGYRLAGWWRVGPRGRPATPAPEVLSDPRVAVRARWLSGAAMALRREVVRANPFDEALAAYGLGEDREMGYRLARRYWLVEARRAIVVHRRDPGQRTDAVRLGFMTSYNYLYIIGRTCRPGAGDWLLAGWSLGVLAAMHLLWALAGDRRGHLGELHGMARGLWAALADMGRGDRARAKGGRGALPAHADAAPAGQGGSATALRSSREGAIPEALPPCRKSTRATTALFVTNRLVPGGAERMLVALSKELGRHGVNPAILCLKEAGPLAGECRAHGIPVFEGCLHHKADAAVIVRMRRIISEIGADVLVAAHSGGDRMFWSALSATLSGVPLVVWSHWFPEAGRRHFERPNRALLRCVEAYVALGERHRLALIRHEHLPAGRIAVIRNAIDTRPFRDGPTWRAVRHRLRLEDDEVAVAIVANLRPEKRHDVFIEAARRLSRTHPKLRFLIIGDGPAGGEVRAAASASGLGAERLAILGARDDVPEVLKGVDISCLCSEIECFSVTMLEAAAAGCAFIGPDTGSLPEFMEHRRNGLQIRPADVDGLADAIAELAADAALRRRLAAEARIKLEREYSLEKMGRSFAELFVSVRGNRRPPTRRVRRIAALASAATWGTEAATTEAAGAEMISAP
jgi:glycosyltransferase involved in cell wall biosynthesis